MVLSQITLFTHELIDDGQALSEISANDIQKDRISSISSAAQKRLLTAKKNIQIGDGVLANEDDTP